jgi:hypothetical protein
MIGNLSLTLIYGGFAVWIFVIGQAKGWTTYPFIFCHRGPWCDHTASWPSSSNSRSSAGTASAANPERIPSLSPGLRGTSYPG